MLIQDTLTGYLHEVPDSQLYEASQVVYDGLGNPLGIFPFVSNIVRGVTSLFRPRQSAPPPTVPVPVQPPPPPEWAQASFPSPFPVPVQPPGFPPQPPGWVQASFPFTGQRRLYLRCSAWPGPQGLMPEGAMQQFPGSPLLPGMTPPGMMPPAAPLRRRRRRR